MERNNPTNNSKEYESKRYALALTTWQQEQALLKLGYLEERDFPLEHRALQEEWFHEFVRAIRAGSFIDSNICATSMSPFTNGSIQFIHIRAFRGDMPKWEKVIADFDGKK